MNTWRLSNTRYQNILSMKPWESNLQARFFCDIEAYSLLFSVRKTTCPRDQDGVMKISYFCKQNFTFTANHKMLFFYKCNTQQISFPYVRKLAVKFWVFMTALLPWVLLCLSRADKKQFIYLKLVSAIFYQTFIFHQMITLQKQWKMFFISSLKLFSLSRYLFFSISVFPYFSPCQTLL